MDVDVTVSDFLFLKLNLLRVFESMALRERETELRAEKFRNKERHDQYCSPNILRVMKSRRMKWAGHVARMSEKKNVSRLLGGGEDI
jgi:hypothetical protein